MTEVEWIQCMSTLNVQKGDIIVVKMNQILSNPEYERIKKIIQKTFESWFPTMSLHVMILEYNMDIGVLRMGSLGDIKEKRNPSEQTLVRPNKIEASGRTLEHPFSDEG